MRQMPTFGQDKIRRFWHNVSRQNKLAARDYEDFLIVSITRAIAAHRSVLTLFDQTAMPAFEGLLPLGDDQTVADLLYELMVWHALAKLRLHTEVTVEVFRAATTHMYAAVRRFARTTCETHVTHELKKESDARARRQGAKLGSKPVKTKARIVKYNGWKTYKYHCLGDHPDYVELAGPLETTSAQTVCPYVHFVRRADRLTVIQGELEHRHVKRVYARTNKNGFAAQIAKHQQRQAIIRGIRLHAREDAVGAGAGPSGPIPLPGQSRKRKRRGRVVPQPRRPKEDPAFDDEHAEIKSPGAGDIGARYDMGISEHDRVQIYNWMTDNKDDPALLARMPAFRCIIFIDINL